ncbi:Os02g0253150, partial [Oryza sativa Japonica Group]
ISPKLLRLELLLDRNPNIRGKVVLVQIVNLARSTVDHGGSNKRSG